MDNRKLETLIFMVDREILKILDNQTMLEWAKNQYLKELGEIRKELEKQLEETEMK